MKDARLNVATERYEIDTKKRKNEEQEGVKVAVGGRAVTWR